MKWFKKKRWYSDNVTFCNLEKALSSTLRIGAINKHACVCMVKAQLFRGASEKGKSCKLSLLGFKCFSGFLVVHNLLEAWSDNCTPQEAVLRVLATPTMVLWSEFIVLHLLSIPSSSLPWLVCNLVMQAGGVMLAGASLTSSKKLGKCSSL